MSKGAGPDQGSCLYGGIDKKTDAILSLLSCFLLNFWKLYTCLPELLNTLFPWMWKGQSIRLKRKHDWWENSEWKAQLRCHAVWDSMWLRLANTMNTCIYALGVDPSPLPMRTTQHTVGVIPCVHGTQHAGIFRAALLLPLKTSNVSVLWTHLALHAGCGTRSLRVMSRRGTLISLYM